jgi:cytochrome oxidase Cu insertion factor (SCO1/SenC/PrrC family)
MSDPSTARTSAYRWLILVGAVLIAGVLLLRFFSPGRVTPSSDLRRYQIVPPFALTERSGKTVTNNDLAGKIWVADFIFTTCPGPCPLITASMAKIQDAVAHDPQVRLVSFTVDPETDTPAVLSAYADKFGADPNRWWFLTGQEKPLYDLIRNGFYMVVQDNHGQPLQDGQFVVTHSTQIVLVDGQGVVRGFFDGVGSDGRADLLKGIKTLEKESP